MIEKNLWVHTGERPVSTQMSSFASGIRANLVNDLIVRRGNEVTERKRRQNVNLSAPSFDFDEFLANGITPAMCQMVHVTPLLLPYDCCRSTPS